VEKYSRAGQAMDDDIPRHMCITCLVKKSYKHTFRICNTYCFSTATIVTRTCRSVMSHYIPRLVTLLLKQSFSLKFLRHCSYIKILQWSL